MKVKVEIYNCPYCGAPVKKDTSGLCPFCWMLWIDQKKYRKLGFLPVADYLKKVLEQRKEVER